MIKFQVLITKASLSSKIEIKIPGHANTLARDFSGFGYKAVLLCNDVEVADWNNGWVYRQVQKPANIFHHPV